MIRGLISGVVGSGSGGSSTGTAAPLPTVTTETAAQIADANAYFTGGTAYLHFPAGDWCLGGWVRFPTGVTTGNGPILSSGAYTGASNIFAMTYSFANGTVGAYGRDAAAVGLGSAGSLYEASAQIGVSAGPVKLNVPVHLCLVKTGSLIRFYKTFLGQAPVLVSEETTLFGAKTSGGISFGVNSNYNYVKMQFSKWFKLSYALTPAQILQVVNGTDPTTLGTPAANDWYFLFSNTDATQTSTINGFTTLRFFSTGYSTVAGFWNAPQTDAVFCDVMGLGDGHVFDAVANGTTPVTLSGTYLGADGADIQVQLIDQDGAVIVPWRTVDIASAGGTWSGVLDAPKKRKWYRVQTRKLVEGVASSDVMTTTVKWGIGKVVLLGGQSLMEHMGTETAPYGSATRTPNGFWSVVGRDRPTVAGVVYDYINVSATADAGGLIKITHATKHGRRTGDRVYPTGIGGTVEANNQYWTVTVTSPTEYTLDGSVYANAFTSGGSVFMTRASVSVATTGIADSLSIIAETIGTTNDCVVSLSNCAIGGTPIANFNSHQGTASYGVWAGLIARSLGKVSAYVWLHGHADIYSNAYFSSGGSSGAWTGWGALGTLYDWNKTMFPNDNFLFGVAAFTAAGGTMVGNAASTQQFRFGMVDWVTRKKANSETNCFFLGHFHDLQPQSENGVMSPNAHLYPSFKGYFAQAERIGLATAKRVLADEANGVGPELASAVRSGATITLTVTHRGGSSLRTLVTGAKLSGFEVATTTNFASPLTILDAQITGANTITLTLASDPGATCYVRYMWGHPGAGATSAHITSRISGVADNGAGLIRINMSSATTAQRTGGHGLVTGDWTTIEGVKDSNGTSPANGTWQVTVIDTENFDLVGSSSAGLGTFTAGQTIYGTSRLPTASKELATPVYDDRLIAGVDSLGLPLQPTYTYVTAA